MTYAAILANPHLRARRHRYLYAGLAVSLLTHICLLSIQFRTNPAPTRAPVSSLEVVLLNARTEQAPVQADVLAQVDMEGGGDAIEGVARSPLPAAPDIESRLPSASAASGVAELEARQRELMARLAAQYASLAQPQAPADAAAHTGATDVPGDTLAQLTQQYAAISQRVEEYNRRPRRHFFAPSASAAPFAEYVEAWRERIERTGNQYYPDAARGRLYGSLRLTVFVRADGSVEDVVMDEPSEHAILNAAARDIVRKAAPFAPFGPEVRRDTDIIAITRTWHFQNDAISMETP